MGWIIEQEKVVLIIFQIFSSITSGIVAI